MLDHNFSLEAVQSLRQNLRPSAQGDLLKPVEPLQRDLVPVSQVGLGLELQELRLRHV